MAKTIKLSSEWKTAKLGEVADKCTAKNREFAYSLVLTNSAQHGVIQQSEHFDKDIAVDENIDGYFVIHDGEFVYNPRISTTAPCGPIRRNHLGETGIMSPLYTIFRLKEGEIDDSFAEYYFLSSAWYKYAKSIANYGVRHDRMAISDADFFSMPIPVPPLVEQHAIAEILTTQDRLIATKQRLIVKLQDFKKVLLKKIFPKNGEDKPEIRFAGFTNAWEQRKLGEVVKMVGGATPSKANPAYWDGDIVWLSSQEIKDRYVSAGTYTITEKAMRESTTKVVPALTPLIVSRSGILARMFPITLPTVDVAINQDIKALFFEKNFLDTDFFVSQLESKEKTILSDTVKTGTTVQSVNMPDFEKLIITIPSMREQLQIGQLFKDLGNLITLHQRELEQQKLVKKYLMQQLLTGKTRVKAVSSK